MDEKTFERSNQAFYQYEARKIIDYLREKGFHTINTDKLLITKKDYDKEQNLNDPELVFLIGERLREDRSDAASFIESMNHHEEEDEEE